jgi:NCS1 family nucleobase:cation symporter-1
VTVTATRPPADDDSGRAFNLERHGIDHIAPANRWATPFDLFGLWAGASVNFEYLIYGAVLMTFGVSLAQAVMLILVGNLSYLIVGVASLQGPQAGTTTFILSRASYGPNGSRLLAFLNWLTMVGFETEGLILVVLAGAALAAKAGYHVGTPLKVALVIAAAALQTVLPFLGHATVTKTLRALVVPFVALYVIMAVLTVGKAHVVHQGAGWQTQMVALAFVIVLSGLGWTECANDYSRYLPENASKPAVVGWVFAGGAVPQILLMLLGAAVASYVPGVASNPIADFPRAFPGWFLVPFLIVVLVQLFAINSLDLYSSGVTLQALGLRISRWYCVLIDTVIACGLTAYAVFSSSFSRLLTDFADVVIVWLGPWTAVFLVDWLMRGRRYRPDELQRTDRGSVYWRTAGVHWPAIAAQVLGSVAAALSINTTFYQSVLSRHTGGADFSVFSGLIVGGVVYAALAWRTVRSEAVVVSSPASRNAPASA